MTDDLHKRAAVKRYDPPFMFSTQKHGRMSESPAGNWISHDDYAALLARLEAVKADLQFMTDNRNKWQDAATKRLARADLPLKVKSLKVKSLEWERGMVDWARPLQGMKYVACSTKPTGYWAWWLNGDSESRAVEPSEKAAKAAAQADYERRIMAALDVPTNQPPTPAEALALPEVRALVEATILDAQLRAFEQCRLDTPDEIKAATNARISAAQEGEG